jgi:hypothetical protein
MNERSDALHARARAFVRAFEEGRPMPEPFDALACDLARFQMEHIPGFERLCRARGKTRFERALDVPGVPTDAFKAARVFAGEEVETVFRTSGTTAGSRGSHYFRTVGTYDAAALAFGRRWLARDLPPRFPIVVIGPTPEAAPDSSLTHMFDRFTRAWGEDAAWFLTEHDALARHVAALRSPALVLGTSFAFVHLLDAGLSLPLPSGSRVMQTGGFKGKSRVVEPAELRASLTEMFGVSAIVSEYGMTELSSQFYEKVLYDHTPHGVYAEPPWAKVTPVDPETLEPTDGIGIARIHDLCNVDSAACVVTQDRVRRVDDGFELLGRAAGAPPRGCSIAIDEMLS